MSGEEHIAYADKAAELIALALEMPYPETFVKKVDGVVGVIQREYQDVAGDLRGRALHDLNKTTLGQVQRQHAFDWLIGNHNTQGSSMLTRENGELLGYEKEPFRFYNRDSIETDFNPYPDQVSYYNHWFGEYAAGALDKGFRLDPKEKTLAKFLDAVDAMGDEDFLGMLKMYSTRAKTAKSGWSEIAFLNEALRRKRTLRRTVEKFYEKLERKRKS